MTSIAFIAGTVPLVLSHGAGAEVRSVTGITVFAGMLGVTCSAVPHPGVLRGTAQAGYPQRWRPAGAAWRTDHPSLTWNPAAAGYRPAADFRGMNP